MFQTQKKKNKKQYDELSILHILKLTKWLQKYIKAYHIIYSQCRSTHLKSNTIEFFIL